MPIDWDQVRLRLRNAEAALAHELTVDPERLDEQYRRRAAALARREDERAPGVAAAHALAFTLGGERYAIDLQLVAEVLPLRGCTPVPGAPAEVLGVINRRGDLLAVVDLMHVFGRAGSPVASGFVVLLRGEEREVGLAVPDAPAIEAIDVSQVGGHEGSTPAAPFVKGCTASGIVVLDGSALLTRVMTLQGERL